MNYLNNLGGAGYGYDTVNKVEFNMWDWYVYSNTTDGDELVAVWSATLGDKYSNRTFYKVNSRWVVSCYPKKLTQSNLTEKSKYMSYSSKATEAQIKEAVSNAFSHFETASFLTCKMSPIQSLF